MLNIYFYYYLKVVAVMLVDKVTIALGIFVEDGLVTVVMVA
jgi:hypothetical protein